MLAKCQQIISVGKDVEKRESLFTVGGNVNCSSHYGKQFGGTLENYIELPYDPAIPLLGIYPDKNFIAHPIFAALFSIAKTWRKPKCPSADE